MESTDNMKLAYDTLVSEAKEWDEHYNDGTYFADTKRKVSKEEKEVEAHNHAMHRLGDKMEKYKEEIFELIIKLDHCS